jgi:hypothetical protein
MDGKRRGWIASAQSFCNDLASCAANIVRFEKRYQGRIRWPNRAIVRDREIAMTPLQQCCQGGRAGAAQADNANHWSRSLFNPIQPDCSLESLPGTMKFDRQNGTEGKDWTPSPPLSFATT